MRRLWAPECRSSGIVIPGYVSGDRAELERRLRHRRHRLDRARSHIDDRRLPSRSLAGHRLLRQRRLRIHRRCCRRYRRLSRRLLNLHQSRLRHRREVAWALEVSQHCTLALEASCKQVRC